MSIFSNKNVLVTGGCGSIGSEIVRQVAAEGPRSIRVYDNHESGHWHLQNELSEQRHLLRALVGDVRDKERLLRALKDVDIVFHAAALKHVPLCEYNPFEAVYTNVIGTQNVVEACLDQGIDKLISISTDKAVNPVNTMGATKLLGERVVVNAPMGRSESRFACVRFGNVLGSEGSVIPLFRKQIAAGGPVTVTSPDMTRFFMTIPQAVKLVLEASEQMEGREIFVLKMDRVRITELAEVMIEALAGEYGYSPEQISIEYIGMRPGEKVNEDLFTAEEAGSIVRQNGMFIIRNSPYDPNRIDDSDTGAMVEAGQGRLLDKDGIRQILTENGFL